MNDPDKRILRLIDLLKYQKTIKTQNQFCDDLGIMRQTIYKIKKGTTHFTVDHIGIICRKYNVNANWVFGKEKKVFNTENSVEI